jgi:tetratricopeptide (TPR) repeat protein
MDNLNSLGKGLESSATKARVAFSSLLRRWRLKPAVVGLVLLGLVLALGAIALPSHRGLGHRILRVFQGTPKIADLKQDVREEPNNAKARLALAHAQFSEGKREAAIRSYDRALTFDKDLDDETMYDNLAACFGTKEQGEAASVIARHKLAKMHNRLSRLTNDKHYHTRWGAVHTLEKIGKASRSDFVHAWVADLDSSECDVRRRAVEELGTKGDRHTLPAIHTARKKDIATKTGWLFKSTCLGDRAQEAEKKILARK